MALPFEPDHEQVKGLIPQRLQGRPFSATTIPTLAQVQALISDVAEEILDRVEADEIPADLHDRARRAVAYETAARLELQFWPEQRRGEVTSTVSAQWHERSEKVLDRLQELISSYDPDQPQHGAPAHSFPTSDRTYEEKFEPLGSKGA